jgi:hypothetical protein
MKRPPIFDKALRIGRRVLIPSSCVLNIAIGGRKDEPLN